MKDFKIFLFLGICVFLSSCSTPVVFDNIDPKNKSSFVELSGDTDFIVITKINGKPVKIKWDNLSNRIHNKFLIKPGKTNIEAYFYRNKDQIIKTCFNLNAGKKYQVRPNWHKTSPLLIATLTNGITYTNINASQCL